MTNQDFGRNNDTTTRGKDSKAQNIGGAASEAFAKVADVARDAGSKAKEAASETAFTVTEQVKELLDRQIGNGASVAGHFASSVRGRVSGPDRRAPDPDRLRLHPAAASAGLRPGRTRWIFYVSYDEERAEHHDLSVDPAESNRGLGSHLWLKV
jgi:ribosomal protein S18 acetylase RimI-like enzyme